MCGMRTLRLTLNRTLLADAEALAKQSAMSTESYLREILEAELAGRRMPRSAGEPRLAGSNGSEPVPYRVHLPR